MPEPGFKNVAEVTNGIAGTHNRGIRGQLQQSHQVSRMVGFGVVEDDIFNFCGIGQAPDLGDIRLPKLFLGRFDDGLFLRIDEI